MSGMNCNFGPLDPGGFFSCSGIEQITEKAALKVPGNLLKRVSHERCTLRMYSQYTFIKEDLLWQRDSQDTQNSSV
jgi:hypothetical protein